MSMSITNNLKPMATFVTDIGKSTIKKIQKC